MKKDIVELVSSKLNFKFFLFGAKQIIF